MKIASIHKAHDDDHTATRRRDVGVELGRRTSAAPPSAPPATESKQAGLRSPQPSRGERGRR
jgi:hypothetical protein